MINLIFLHRLDTRYSDARTAIVSIFWLNVLVNYHVVFALFEHDHLMCLWYLHRLDPRIQFLFKISYIENHLTNSQRNKKKSSKKNYSPIVVCRCNSRSASASCSDPNDSSLDEWNRSRAIIKIYEKTKK